MTEVLRIPIGPAAPAVPGRMVVPAQVRVVDGHSIPGSAFQGPLRDGPWLLVSRQLKTVETPPEFFLRSLPNSPHPPVVDAEGQDDGPPGALDDDQVIDWCTTWGIPNVPPRLTRETTGVVSASPQLELLVTDHSLSNAARSILGHGPGASWRALPEQLVDEAIRAGFGDLRSHGALVHYDEEGQIFDAVPLGIARYSLQLHGCLVRSWIQVPPVITTDWLEEPWSAADPAWRPLGRPANRLDSLFTAIELTNDLLIASAALQLDLVTYPQGTSLKPPPYDLSDVVALGLAQFIADEIPARRCENEPCRTYYVRQTGRAEHGQHRTTGTKYCSKACARAQAERQRRRRK